MNNDKDKELDDLFRKGLQDPVGSAYREDDWSALEQMLKKSGKPRVIYWPYISSAAAILLLFLGWWAFRPKSGQQAQPLVAVSHKPAGVVAPAASVQHPATQEQNELRLADQSQVAKTTGIKTVNTHLYSNGSNGSAGSSKNLVETNPGKQIVSLKQTERNPVDVNESGREFVLLSSADIKPAFENELINQPPGSSPDLMRRRGASLPESGKSKPKIIAQAFRPQFALTVLAAPDLNGVGSFQQSKVGTNIGLQFSAGLSKKFTVTTGVIYSAKPYLTNFDSYHTLYKFPVTPVNVTADCRMLDIPLNVGYQVYNKHQNRISVGTGLSSYLMLHENYTFNYAASTPSSYGHSYASPTSYTVPHSKSYLMGVFNLNATYERPVSSKLDIAVEPYLKLPLANIGYSQVRLQSTGVAVGLKWNLNSSAKP